MSDSDRDEEQERSLARRLAGTALLPVHAATSKTAQRAYLSTFLFGAATLFLLFLSTVAYTLFYLNYVPHDGLESVVHLQFGNGHPHGTTSLPRPLVSLQSYDISIALHLPRTPANIATGNFMIDLALLSPSSPTTSPVEVLQASIGQENGSTAVLGRSRRPAIMTQTSPIVDTANVLANLPLFVLGWKKESEWVEVSMYEGVEFAKGWKNVPDKVQVVIEADEKMQFYAAQVKIRARFQGLRWILHNHRIMSFFFFTTTFFSVSATSAFLAYFAFGFFKAPEPEQGSKAGQDDHDLIKQEPADPNNAPYNPLSTSDLSDTPRTFPTIGRHAAPLQYVGRDSGYETKEEPRVKKEEDEDLDASTGIQPLIGEADDEDEDEDADEAASAWRDSGIGTGRDEVGGGDRRGGMQRRKPSRSGQL